jgi:hypothetical protein
VKGCWKNSVFGREDIEMKRVLFSAFALLVFTGACAWADVLTGITSSAGLTDTVNWAQLGPTFTLETTAEPWTSADGVTGLVGITGTPFGTQNFERLDQGNGWSGNFSPGDAVLWNQGGFDQSNIDFGIQFTAPSYGGGLQIQADFFGAFEATITAYDPLGNVLGTFSEAGNSTSNGDGSAIFIGLLDNVQNISFLDFNVVGSDGGDSMGIDTLYLTGTVPEPQSLLLLGSVLVLCGLAWRRKIA